MYLNEMMPNIVGMLVIVLLIGIVLQRLRQPQVVAYLLAGILMGPHGFALISDTRVFDQLGDIGIVLLLFFVGMEMSLQQLLLNWKISVIGTIVQIVLSVVVTYVLGMCFGWPIARCVLLGFVISLSSTAVVVPLLRDYGEMGSPLGRDVIGILLVQDMAIVPMLIILGYFSGHQAGFVEVAAQIVGGISIVILLAVLAKKGRIRLPLGGILKKNHELQVFTAFIMCFGCALVTSLMGLSSAVGAFVAGIVVSAANETQWVQDKLEPFRVLLVALFFVSVGMLLEWTFFQEHLDVVLLLVGATLITNMLLNACIFRMHKRSWSDSFYAGALLSQLGEFSFVLAAIGFEAGVIRYFGYQMTIALIVLSLIISPFLIAMVRWMRRT